MDHGAGRLGAWVLARAVSEGAVGYFDVGAGVGVVGTEEEALRMVRTRLTRVEVR